MEARNDKTLAFNAAKDPCLSLTKQQVVLGKDLNYRDMEAQMKALVVNAFKDPCPRPPRSRSSSAGFEYGDMEEQGGKTLAFNAFNDPYLPLT